MTPQPSEAAWERARVLGSTTCVHGFRYDKDERGNEARRVAMDCMECVALAIDSALIQARAEGEAAGAAREREECATIVEGITTPASRLILAAAIRARGEAKT